MIYKGKGGIEYNLSSSPFAQGGEGMIFDILGKPNLVAKLYKNGLNNIEKEKKLIAMVDNPPDNSVMSQISWPVDVLYDNNKTFVGFIMHKLKINEELNVIYEYGDSAKYPDTPWSSKIVIAKNLCVVLNAVHEAGHVVGDLNPKNISVDPSTGHVIFVDTDSYHIEDNGQVYRCNVGMPEYLPVEIQKKMKGGLSSCPLPTFSEHTDNFALAVHIFQLLMNSCHPFSCRVLPSQASVAFPQPTDNILNGVFPFMQPKAGTAIPIFAPSIDILPKEMQELFKRAFIEGHTDPSRRPNPVEWHTALTKLEKDLVRCKKVGHHVYYKKSTDCPWCEVDSKFGKGVVSANNKKLKQTTIQAPIVAAPPKQNNTTQVKQKNTTRFHAPQSKTSKVIQSIALIVSIIAIVFGVVLLKDPQKIFTYIKWGWVLGISIGLVVVLILIGFINCLKNGKIQQGCIQIALSCCYLTLMIFGLCLAYTHTYYLSNVKDFNLLNNLPTKDEQVYNLELTNDIDFSDVELTKYKSDGSKYYPTGYFYGNYNDYKLNGKGYSIKNIKCNIDVSGARVTFLNLQSVCDLTMKDCEFTIRPNYYDNDSHEGEECTFSIISISTASNFNLAAKVRVLKAYEDMRYITKSTIKDIYPTNTVENGCNISVVISKEG